MTNEIALSEQTAPTTNNFLAVIAKIAADPSLDVAKMNGILDIQIRMMDRQAEIDFSNALAKVQAKMPRIKKSGQIVIKGQVMSSYAKYEDIDAVIRPILLEHGFSLRFNSKSTGDKIIVYGTLSHEGGHSITDEIPLTIEASGAKNSVQGVGSTITYGQRYLVKMMLNLVFEGEDDDGQKASLIPVSDDQAQEISDLLRTTGAPLPEFLNFIGAKSIEAIDTRDYERAISAINRRAKAKSAPAEDFPGDRP